MPSPAKELIPCTAFAPQAQTPKVCIPPGFKLPNSTLIPKLNPKPLTLNPKPIELNPEPIRWPKAYEVPLLQPEQPDSDRLSLLIERFYRILP